MRITIPRIPTYMSLCTFESAFYIFVVIEVILRNVEKRNHHKSTVYLLVHLFFHQLLLNWNLIKEEEKEEEHKITFDIVLNICSFHLKP